LVRQQGLPWEHHHCANAETKNKGTFDLAPTKTWQLILLQRLKMKVSQVLLAEVGVEAMLRKTMAARWRVVVPQYKVCADW
jgi:hypothetical protein